jgi:hypothetical protein
MTNMEQIDKKLLTVASDAPKTGFLGSNKGKTDIFEKSKKYLEVSWKYSLYQDFMEIS